jgi:hypothetical protein
MNKITNEIIIPRWRFSPLRLFSKQRKRTFVSHTPTNWNECTPEQLRLIAQVYTGSKDQDINRRMMLSFLNVPRRFLKHMSYSQLDSIANTLDFVFKQQTLTHQTMRNFKIGDAAFTGPTDRLASITFNQFIYADTMFLQYVKKEKPEYLHQMMAALWLKIPEKEISISPTDFNPDHIQENAQLIAKLNQKQQLIALLYYVGCRNYIIKRHPNLFPEKNTMSSQKTDSASWQDTMFQLVGDKPGDKGKVENLNVFFALGWLDRQAKAAASQIANLKKTK